MKKTLIFMTLLLTAAIAFAGNLQPSAAPAPTMKTLDQVEPRIPISDATTPGDKTCRYKITEPGSYYLTGNFDIAFRDGILIDSSDVTIDLMGYRIYSSYITVPIGMFDTFDGIRISSGKTNITIKNGSIVSDNTQYAQGTAQGFRNGIYSQYSDNTKSINIEDITIKNSRQNGIDIYCTGVKIKNCTLINNGRYAAQTVYAIRVGGESEVSNCLVYGNGQYATSSVYGIKASTSSRITDNKIYENGMGVNASLPHNYVDGISADYECYVAGNLVHHNGSQASCEKVVGIYANNNSKIINNLSNKNGSHGQCAVTGIQTNYGSIVSNNQSCSNGASATGTVKGIYAVANCKILGNIVSSNGHNTTSNNYGIYVYNYCIIKDNNVSDNFQSATGSVKFGIYAYENCLIDGNVAVNNNGTNLYNLQNSTIGTNLAP